MKRIFFLAIIFCINGVSYAQTTFQAGEYKPQSADASTLQRSLQRIEERNKKFDADYAAALQQYTDALKEKKESVALVYLNKCISINDNATANSHRIEDPGHLLILKAELLTSTNKEEATDTYRNAIARYCQTDSYDKAIGVFPKLFKLEMSDVDRLWLVDCYTRANKDDEALALLNRIIPDANSAITARCFYQKSIILAKRNDMKGAIQLIDKSIEMNPDPSLYALRAQYYTCSQQYESAVKDWQFFKEHMPMPEQQRTEIEAEIWKAQYLLAKQTNDKPLLKQATTELKKLQNTVPNTTEFLKANK